MIMVTRFDGRAYYINPHLIESIESNPDTTITFLPAKKIVVKETIDDVIARIVSYRKKIGIAISDAEGNDRVLGGQGNL